VPGVVKPAPNDSAMTTAELNRWAAESVNMGEITDEQKEILLAPVDRECVEIRPDGLIYLPWMEYAERLTRAFPFQWAVIPQGKPKMKDGLILWAFILTLRGHYAGHAVGEQQWQANNRTMSWGDALEGAKSNALMRLCKGLGMTLELWKPSFIRAWVKEFAEKYYSESKEKNMWRKKLNGQAQPSATAEPEQQQEDIVDAGRKKISELVIDICDNKPDKVAETIATLTNGSCVTAASIPASLITSVGKQLMKMYNDKHREDV